MRESRRYPPFPDLVLQRCYKGRSQNAATRGDRASHRRGHALDEVGLVDVGLVDDAPLANLMRIAVTKARAS